MTSQKTQNQGSSRQRCLRTQKGGLRVSQAIAIPIEGVVEEGPRAVVAARELSRRYGDGDMAVDALCDVSLLSLIHI